jgi:site-specific DNA recombinase
VRRADRLFDIIQALRGKSQPTTAAALAGALFLKDLADKTRRGLRGRVEAGKPGGGNSIGYDVVRRLDAEGLPVRGERRINAAQAGIVRRYLTTMRRAKRLRRLPSN